MSNPYAPPEDRPRADGVPGEGTPPADGAPAPPEDRPPADMPHGDRSPAGVPYERRSPAGVPYERPRGTAAGPPPRPEDLHRVAVLTRTTALLVLAAVVADLLRFPLLVAAVPFIVAAVATGIRALSVSARLRVRGGPVAVIGLLIAVAVLALANPARALLLWDEQSAFARCTAGAITVQAQNACEEDLQQAVDRRTGDLTRQTP